MAFNLPRNGLTVTGLPTGVARRTAGLMFAFTVLSWLGEYVHNLFELPDLTLFSPENSIPGAISLVLFVIWWLTPAKRVAAVLVLAWAVLHLLGGAIFAVLPLPFLPFVPGQTIDHYAAHVWYGLAQLPLILFVMRQLRSK